MTRSRRRAPLSIKILSILIALMVVGVLVLYRFSILGYFFHDSLYVSPIPSTLSSKTLKNSEEFLDTLASTLKKKHIPYRSITYIQESIYKVSGEQGEVILFTSKKSLDEQISSLQLILSSLTIEGKHFSKIDLRFDKPVIVSK